MEKNKRVRGSNFTEREELLLLQEAQKYKHILDCKLIDKINNRQKIEAWNNICFKFNMHNYTHRNASQLKKKYENIQIKARKMVRAFKTGADPSAYVMDKVMQMMINIMATTNTNRTNKALDNRTAEENSLVVNMPSEKQTHVENRSAESVQEETNTEEVITVNNADENSVEQTDTSLEILHEHNYNQEQNNYPVNWSTYTARQLKPQRPKRYKYVSLNRSFVKMKDKYYFTKIKMVEQITNNFRSKAVREAEEHYRKMRLLDLEIKIKEKMLEGTDT